MTTSTHPVTGPRSNLYGVGRDVADVIRSTVCNIDPDAVRPGTARHRDAVLFWSLWESARQGCDREASICDCVAVVAISDPDAKRLRRLAARIWPVG
jgi:hypothetical protein